MIYLNRDKNVLHRLEMLVGFSGIDFLDTCFTILDRNGKDIDFFNACRETVRITNQSTTLEDF